METKLLFLSLFWKNTYVFLVQRAFGKSPLGNSLAQGNHPWKDLTQGNYPYTDVSDSEGPDLWAQLEICKEEGDDACPSTSDKNPGGTASGTMGSHWGVFFRGKQPVGDPSEP